MSPLRQALDDYLAVRRALGDQLARAEKLLAQFLTYLEAAGAQHVRTDTALAWATLPTAASQNWWAYRLALVCGFAVYLRSIDSATEVPPANLLPWQRRRATPYLYSQEDVAALIAAAVTLRLPYRVATYQTLIGLLAVTGIRIGEAIALDLDDFDARDGVLMVREGKFGKSRELPLHPSAVAALIGYLRRGDRPRAAGTPALLLSTKGTRLRYSNVQLAFGRLVRQTGLTPRSASCRPRGHDLRHSFVVRTVVDGYHEDGDPKTRLALLSTYLGHVSPGMTYWYLSAALELLGLASERLERHLGGES